MVPEIQQAQEEVAVGSAERRCWKLRWLGK